MKVSAIALALAAVAGLGALQPPPLPSTPLEFGFFQARFNADGTFLLEGKGWPSFKGSWTFDSGVVTITTAPGAKGECASPARYRATVAGTRVTLALVDDDCTPRRMILSGSQWRPVGEPEVVPERRIARSGTDAPRLPAAGSGRGSWPSFRGREASGVADGQRLPDRWDGTTGQHVRWRRSIPGLAHSSPIVWGDRVFVTTAVSSRGSATFKPGLYGDGDASEDRSPQKWMVMALDAKSGAVLWERVAHEGAPLEKRHVKSTYASSTPATDGRVVVAFFGSHGVHAFDVDGTRLWKVDLGRLDVGAYDIPTFEWGTASSPVIWNDLVLLQCDTQADSFLLALDVKTGKTVWKTGRDELPSWGTPTVVTTGSGPELLTNGATYVRGYDPRTGAELWRLGGSSKITAPTPIAADGLFVIASGRAPERPIFAVRPGARGDLTLKAGETASRDVVWSRTNRGPYMPMPIAYQGILYVLNNNGLFDAYDVKTGAEIYRQRLPDVGNGFSASPVAADGKIYLSSEDGDMLVIRAGRTFEHVATNRMGELLMATPALANGTMYVRTVNTLFAIGIK